MKLELSHAKDPSPISCMQEEPYIRKCQQSGSQNHLQPFEVVGQFLRWGGDITPLPFSFHFISLVRRQTNPYIFPLFVELESFKVKISSNCWRSSSSYFQARVSKIDNGKNFTHLYTPSHQISKIWMKPENSSLWFFVGSYMFQVIFRGRKDPLLMKTVTRALPPEVCN